MQNVWTPRTILVLRSPNVSCLLNLYSCGESQNWSVCDIRVKLNNEGTGLGSLPSVKNGNSQRFFSVGLSFLFLLWRISASTLWNGFRKKNWVKKRGLWCQTSGTFELSIFWKYYLKTLQKMTDAKLISCGFLIILVGIHFIVLLTVTNWCLEIALCRHGALLPGLGDPPAFEKPARYCPRPGQGFTRPPVCPIRSPPRRSTR